MPGIVRQRRETEPPESETFTPRSATRWSRISLRLREPSANLRPMIARRRQTIARAPGAIVARRHKTANNDATNATTDRSPRYGAPEVPVRQTERRVAPTLLHVPGRPNRTP